MTSTICLEDLMNILVFLKQVPDTETKIQIAGDGASIVEDGVTFIVSPYDEFAIEEAVKTKETVGGEVTAVSMGPKRAEQALRTALAMGCDKAVHLEDDAFQGADAFATSRALAAVIRKLNPDIAFFGKQGVGGDNTSVGQMAAEMADIPHIGMCVRFTLEDDTVKGEREIEGGRETIEAALPVVVTAQKGLNEPRYPNIRGIMQAKKKPIEKLLPADLGLDAGDVGTAGSKTRIETLTLPPAREAGKKIDVEAEEAARQIVAFLKTEAKVL